MNFKKACIFMLVVAIATLFAAGQVGMAKTKIEWMQWFAPEMGEEKVNSVLDLFHAEHPEIEVKLVTLPFGKMREQILSLHTIGKIPDVLGINMPWNAEFGDLNVLEPLDSYLASVTVFNVSDLVQAPIQNYKGHSWMVPLTAHPFISYYNKDLLKKAGIDTPPSSWEELKETAVKTTSPEENEFGYAMILSLLPPSNGPIIEVYPLLYTAGGRTIKDGRANLNSPEVIETLSFLKTLHDLGVVMPGTHTRTESRKIEEFGAGHIAMMVDSMPIISVLRLRAPDLNFGVTPVPKKRKWAARNHGWELGIASKSKNKEAAWTFISWLLTPGVNGQFAQLSNQLPGNTAASGEFIEKDPMLQIAQYILKNHEMVEELMLTPKAPASWRIFTEEIQKMIRGEQDVAQTVKNASDRWNELFTK